MQDATPLSKLAMRSHYKFLEDFESMLQSRVEKEQLKHRTGPRS